jgi:hypothetical protein
MTTKTSVDRLRATNSPSTLDEPDVTCNLTLLRIRTVRFEGEVLAVLLQDTLYIARGQIERTQPIAQYVASTVAQTAFEAFDTTLGPESLGARVWTMEYADGGGINLDDLAQGLRFASISSGFLDDLRMALDAAVDVELTFDGGEFVSGPNPLPTR